MAAIDPDLTSKLRAARSKRLLRRVLAVLSAVFVASCDRPSLLNHTVYTGDLTITRNVAYEPGPRQDLDIYQPKGGGTDRPLVIFFYGGSWRGGSKSYYPFVAASLAHEGAVVMVPDYRVWPEAVYPEFLQDNAAAVAWAIAHAGAYGANSRRVFLVGHSAGAYNAVMLALNPVWLRGVGLSPGDLAGVVGIAGPYNFAPITDPNYTVVFAPGGNGAATQPITYANGHAPPMLLVVGDDDHTVGMRDTVALTSRIEALGGTVADKIYPGIGHLGIIGAFAPILRWRAPVLRDTWDFIAAHPAVAG